MNTSRSIQREIKSIISTLSSETDFSPSAFLEMVPLGLMQYKGTRHLQSTLSKLLTEYREKRQYGRLAKGLLLALLLEGEEYIQELESKGILLCDDRVEKKFLNMLSELQKVLSRMEGPSYEFLKSRLTTYINFCHLNKILENRLQKLAKLLRNRSPSLIKAALGLSELFFMDRYYQFSHINKPMMLKRIEKAVRTPEIFASMVSCLIWKANELSPIT